MSVFVGKFKSQYWFFSLNGGQAQANANIAEGLATCLQFFDDIKQTRDGCQKFCVLICSSPPYVVSVMENGKYAGSSLEQIAVQFCEVWWLEIERVMRCFLCILHCVVIICPDRKVFSCLYYRREKCRYYLNYTKMPAAIWPWRRPKIILEMRVIWCCLMDLGKLVPCQRIILIRCFVSISNWIFIVWKRELWVLPRIRRRRIVIYRCRVLNRILLILDHQHQLWMLLLDKRRRR